MIIKNIGILFLLICSFFIFDKEKINAEQTNISVDGEILNGAIDDNTYANKVSAKPRVVPFVVEENLIFFKATIKGIEDTLNFVFDSGAGGFVLDSTIAAKNKIEPFTETVTSGASGSANYKVASIEKFQVNGLELNDIMTVLVDLNHLGHRLSEGPSKGLSIDGIIGSDLLFNYVTKIDYDKKEFIFYNDISEVNTLYKSKLNLNLDWRIPQIPIGIKLKSGEEFEGNVLMDSGSASNLTLNSNITSDNKLLESFNPKIKTYSTSLTGDEDEYLSTLHSLNFNKEEHFDVPVDIPLSSAGVNAMPGLLGILGNGILKRYNLIFDYKNLTAYYEPNKFIDEKFDYPCTEFYIKKEGQKLLFKNVQKNSVEHKNGIENGMEIKSVNGYGIEDFTKIKKFLYKESIKLEIEYLTRNGKKKTFVIETKRKI